MIRGHLSTAAHAPLVGSHDAGGMKKTLVLCSLLALTVTGCAERTLATEARALRTDLASLPGVATATLDYTEPVPLDSGKLHVRVAMTRTAGVDEVLRVTETAYDAFRGTHHDEEADLTVTFPDGTVHVRAFQPQASLAAVSAALVNGLSAVEDDRSVDVDLMTQDVKAGDHVRATYVVTLPSGSDADDVLPALDELRTLHDDSRLVGWGVAAADGSALAYDRGFPTAELRSTFARMQDPALPPYVRGTGGGWVFVDTRVHAGADLRDAAVRRSLDRVAHRQLRALGAAPVWAYEVHQGKRMVVSIDKGICVANSESVWDRELEAWSQRVGGGC